MKKTLQAVATVALLGLVHETSQAQNAPKSVFDNLSIEAQYGLNTPLTPNEGITTSDYSNINFFQIALTHHIDHVWGIRGSFAQSNFKHKEVDDLGAMYSKLTLEATYNIFTSINDLKQAFDITAHAGFGLGIGKSESLPGQDYIGAIQIGLMPTYQFTPQLAVFVDGTYVHQFSQDFGYNGLGIKQGTASYINAGLGLRYHFRAH